MAAGAITQQARPDTEDFPQVAAEGYRRELFAHCYRMVGSVHDAEDLVQETYLRAWRAYHGFEKRSSLRTWLYRIATNTCLTALQGRDRRPLPTGLGAPDSPIGDELVERAEVPWLEPAPDARTISPDADPAEAVAARESIRLAFVAALQHLPPRQRAVLILRDVLAWRASEVAAALNTSTAAANSLLQRARLQLQQTRIHPDELVDPDSREQRELLDRYVAAFWEKDIDTIVSLLTEDAVWEMPPFVGWYRGTDVIAWLIGTKCPGGCRDMRMVETRANGQPAFGLYMRTPEGTFVPFHLQVLTLSPRGVNHVVAFFDTSLFSKFGLPEQLPAVSGP